MLRKMTPGDEDKYLALAAEFYSTDAVSHPVPVSCFQSVFDEIMRSDERLEGYILESDGHTAGYAVISKMFATETGGLALWIEDIYIKPEYRSKGLGRELFEHVESLPHARLRLEASRSNERAIKLYKSLGFVEIPYVQLIKDAETEPEQKIEYIREYVTPAAAGYASPAEGEDYTLVPKDKDAPKNADFAVRIAGDSMEPYIKDGSRVYVSRDIDLHDGDVGIFFVDGDMKCKQYCEDVFGNIYLFSLNRDRTDADITVMAGSGVTVFCFGRVLLPKRPPLPGR